MWVQIFLRNVFIILQVYGFYKVRHQGLRELPCYKIRKIYKITLLAKNEETY